MPGMLSRRSFARDRRRSRSAPLRYASVRYLGPFVLLASFACSGERADVSPRSNGGVGGDGGASSRAGSSPGGAGGGSGVTATGGRGGGTAGGSGAGTGGAGGSGAGRGGTGDGGGGTSGGSGGAEVAGSSSGASGKGGAGAGGVAGAAGGGAAGAGGSGGMSAAAGVSGEGGSESGPYQGCEGEDRDDNTCPVTGSICHQDYGCEPPCSGGAMCPDPPPGGTATTYCNQGFCRLDCTLDLTCPTGMTCDETTAFCKPS